MSNVKYTSSINYSCLEYLSETSLDISLIHAGKEDCKPSHVCSGARDEYILHYIFSGKGFYSLKDGTTYTLSAGQMFLIRPGESVTYGSDTIEPWQYVWIGFKGIRADTILKQCGFSKNICILLLPVQSGSILNYINNILNCKDSAFSNDLQREACMLMFFSKCADVHEKLSHKDTLDNRNNGLSAYVELAVEYIKYYYKNGINVSDIVSYLNISQAYLNRAFQKELGMSIQKFLIDYRMHKAANLLISTTDSVKDVAKAIGYEDQLNFSKAFKKKFGISPKNYRLQKTTP